MQLDEFFRRMLRAKRIDRVSTIEVEANKRYREKRNHLGYSPGELLDCPVPHLRQNQQY